MAEKQQGSLIEMKSTTYELAEKAEKQIGGEGGEADMNVNRINDIRAEKEKAEKHGIPLGITNRPTRRVGGRTFKRLESEVDIASNGPWLLVAVPQWSRDGWLSLKLFRDAQARKRCWYLGCKNGLMARNTDAALLAAHHPELVAWVVEQATEYQRHNNNL